MCCSPWIWIPRVILLIALLLGGQGLSGQEGVLIDLERVRFERLAEDWLRTEIEIEANRNSAASNPRFVSDIRVGLILSLQKKDGSFSFYRSEVEVVALEQNQSATVSFFLPGVILERDDVREPFAYLIELSVGGVAQPLTQRSASSNIQSNPQAMASLKSRAEAEGEQTDGILLPEYLAPIAYRNPREAPVYRRRQPEAP